MKKEELLNLYKRYRIYLYPILVIVAGLILIGLVILPQTLRLISNNKVEDELTNRFKSLEVKADELKNVSLQDLSTEVSTALNAFPSEKDYGNAIGILQNVTVQNGFTILGLVLNDSSEGNSKIGQNYIIRIEILGQRSKLRTLLDQIETSQRIMKLQSMDITTGRDSDTINATLAINIYYSPIPKSFGSIDAPLPKLSQEEEALLQELSRSSVGLGTGSLYTPNGKSNPFE